MSASRVGSSRSSSLLFVPVGISLGSSWRGPQPRAPRGFHLVILSLALGKPNHFGCSKNGSQLTIQARACFEPIVA